MMIEFEFTDQEYPLLLDAVRHAKENAVSTEAHSGFQNVHTELISQHEEWMESQRSKNGESGERHE